MAELEKLIGSESPLEVGQKINAIVDAIGDGNLANKDLSNLTTTGQAKFDAKVSKSELSECHVVIQTYQNGTSWYRVWSDGWIEQGGYASGGNITVTLLKPFTNADYTVLVTVHAGGTPLVASGYKDKTTTNFYLWGRSFSASDGYSGNTWYAFGY